MTQWDARAWLRKTANRYWHPSPRSAHHVDRVNALTSSTGLTVVVRSYPSAFSHYVDMFAEGRQPDGHPRCSTLQFWTTWPLHSCRSEQLAILSFTTPQNMSTVFG